MKNIAKFLFTYLIQEYNHGLYVNRQEFYNKSLYT